MNKNDYVKILQALLFQKPSGVKYVECISYMNIDKKSFLEIIELFKESLSNTAFDCVDTGTSLQMVVRQEYANIIEKKDVEYRNGELTRAQLEALTLVIYGGGIAKAEIDFIRGVNSQSILRTLAIRGLVERVHKKGIGYVYIPTLELLRYIGVVDTKQIDGSQELREMLERFREQEKDDSYEED